MALQKFARAQTASRFIVAFDAGEPYKPLFAFSCEALPKFKDLDELSTILQWLVEKQAALDETAAVADWTLHDLRRTFATGLAKLGVQIPVIERLLNHVSRTFAGVVGTYNRHDYWKEMTEAVEKWEAYILAITA